MLRVALMWFLVLGTTGFLTSELVGAHVAGSAERVFIWHVEEALLLYLFCLLHLVPLVIVFEPLVLTVTHYLSHQFLDVLALYFLRGQVLAVVAVDLVHAALNLLM